MSKNQTSLTESPVQLAQVVIDPKTLSHIFEDDSFSLAKIFLSLTRQKLIFIWGLLILLTLVAFYVFFSTTKFDYITTIQIGTEFVGSSSSDNEQIISSNLVQPPKTVVSILQKSIIPIQLQQQHKQFPENKLKISVSTPKDTDIVILSSKGSDKQEAEISKLHQSVIDTLAVSHMKKTASKITALNDLLFDAEQKLKQTKSLSNEINSATTEKSTQISRLESTIEETNWKLAQFMPTQAPFETIKSIEPSGLSKKTIIFIGVILSFISAIFIALFFDFLSNLKELST